MVPSTIATGVRVCCTPRVQPLPAIISRTPGSPTRPIRSHDVAASAVAPAPPASSRVAGSANTSPPATSTVPIPTANQLAWTPSSTARSVCPAPNHRAERPVVPYSTKSPTTRSRKNSAAAIPNPDNETTPR